MDNGDSHIPMLGITNGVKRENQGLPMVQDQGGARVIPIKPAEQLQAPEMKYSCVLVIQEKTTGEQILVTKLDSGSRGAMQALCDLLQDPHVQIAKGLHLYGAAVGAVYANRPHMKFVSSVTVAAV